MGLYSVLLGAVPVLSGCAGSSPDGVTPATAVAPSQPGTYQLTDEDKGLDCKSLTGRMQVRILQERDYVQRSQTSGLSRSVKAGVTTVFGGSAYGSDPEADHARTVAMLEAYNKQLAAKGCRTFDLAAELQPKPVTVTPLPKAKDAPAKK